MLAASPAFLGFLHFLSAHAPPVEDFPLPDAPFHLHSFLCLARTTSSGLSLKITSLQSFSRSPGPSVPAP